MSFKSARAKTFAAKTMSQKMLQEIEVQIEQVDHLCCYYNSEMYWFGMQAVTEREQITASFAESALQRRRLPSMRLDTTRERSQRSKWNASRRCVVLCCVVYSLLVMERLTRLRASPSSAECDCRPRL